MCFHRINPDDLKAWKNKMHQDLERTMDKLLGENSAQAEQTESSLEDLEIESSLDELEDDFTDSFIGLMDAHIQRNNLESIPLLQEVRNEFRNRVQRPRDQRYSVPDDPEAPDSEETFFERVQRLFQKMLEAVQKMWQKALSWLWKMLSWLQKALSWLQETVKALIQEFVCFVKYLWNQLKSLFSALASFFRPALLV
ncbi:interleukin-32 isoform X1 [Nycticebus coucang]|uniref:interleukin-32 isoform X1 n=1 Tax=Nycticebus coucang TaxID=9470 RepID=UPI00234DB837|nr:interleukin-32 isoform X1 [Nycticebus coucang]XP_053410257.1 interleukin-32 isoform X1 [Nycticebus coucang]